MCRYFHEKWEKAAGLIHDMVTEAARMNGQSDIESKMRAMIRQSNRITPVEAESEFNKTWAQIEKNMIQKLDLGIGRSICIVCVRWMI